MRIGKGIKFFKSLTDVEIQEIIDYYPNQTALAKALGMHGGWFSHVKEVLFSGRFNTSEWESKKKKSRRERDMTWLTPEIRNRLGNRTREKARERLESEILQGLFIENSLYSSLTARQIVRRWNWYYKWLEDRCALCTLPPEWMGKKLVLQVDHKNGVSNDHRLENLRLLCPNCHSQTETFAGGNKPQKRKKRGLLPEKGTDRIRGGVYRGPPHLDHSEGLEPSSSGPEPDVLPLDDE